MNPAMTPAAATPLIEAFLLITRAWLGVFPRRRSFMRAVRQAPGGLLCLGRLP